MFIIPDVAQVVTKSILRISYFTEFSLVDPDKIIANWVVTKQTETKLII